MTEAQAAHAAQLADEVERRLVHKYAKYAKGAQEHGGNLWNMAPLELLEEAISEAIDQCVYLLTLKEQLENFQPTDLGVGDVS